MFRFERGLPLFVGHDDILTTLSFTRPALVASGECPMSACYNVKLGTTRLCDAWDGVRAGQSHDYPNHRDCANLGHVADDEAALIPMRV